MTTFGGKFCGNLGYFLFYPLVTLMDGYMGKR